MQTIQTEIKEPVNLCNSEGQLNPAAIGWGRFPFIQANLKGSYLRKKKWDYWCFIDEKFMFSVTVSNLDYTLAAFIYILDFETKEYAEETVLQVFPGQGHLPNSTEGLIQFKKDGLDIEIDAQEQQVNFKVSSTKLGGKSCRAEINALRPPGHESLNVVVPWSQKRFQFTSKQHCLPVSGTIQWGGAEYKFAKDTAFACLDYGRGKWPYSSSWNWAAFGGKSGEDVIGVNMGARWTDNTGMNENGIILNGRLFKIFDEINFQYNPDNFMEPWSMSSGPSEVLELEFTPFYERVAATNFVILNTSVHQIFGRYSGQIKLGQKTYKIENITGWAEEHYARW